MYHYHMQTLTMQLALRMSSSNKLPVSCHSQFTSKAIQCWKRPTAKKNSRKKRATANTICSDRHNDVKIGRATTIYYLSIAKFVVFYSVYKTFCDLHISFFNMISLSAWFTLYIFLSIRITIYICSSLQSHICMTNSNILCIYAS